VLTFKLYDFLTGNAALHARNSATASWRYWCFTINAQDAGCPRRFAAGRVDITLALFFNALLNEIHGVSH
jgi:hypothetical protein